MSAGRADQAVLEAWIAGYAEKADRIDLHVMTGALAVAHPRMTLDGMRVSRALRKAGFNRSYAARDSAGCIYRRKA